MKKLLIISFLAIAFSCTKEVGVSEEQVKKVKNNPQAEAVLASTLTHNSDGTFTIDYGGATNVVWLFLRSGNSLYPNGNVIPENSQSWYLQAPGTFSSWVSGAWYQAVIVRGTTQPDANGVVGSAWIEEFTNKVQ
jgi:hypothetical protein